MSNSNTFFFLGAAVVGIMSAAGMYLVEHFREERRRRAMAQNLARIDQQLTCVQQELEQLRKLQKEKSALKLRKRKALKSTTASVVSDDFKTVSELDSSDLEFYDLSDDEVDVETVTANETVLELIDAKLNTDDLGSVNEVLNQLKDLRLESPEDPLLLWRIGKAYYKLANASKELTVQDDYAERGITACQTALNINPKIGETHKWLATLIGFRSGHQPIREKIGSGILFKEHLDKAVELLPNDTTIHHLLGRFEYENASLKWYERKIASTFFAELPASSFDVALSHFLEAERLTKDSPWKENKLFIAKCQIALGKYKEAIPILQEADLINESKDTVSEIDTEVQVLLQKYNSYSN